MAFYGKYFPKVQGQILSKHLPLRYESKSAQCNREAEAEVTSCPLGESLPDELKI